MEGDPVMYTQHDWTPSALSMRGLFGQHRPLGCLVEFIILQNVTLFELNSSEFARSELSEQDGFNRTTEAILGHSDFTPPCCTSLTTLRLQGLDADANGPPPGLRATATQARSLLLARFSLAKQLGTRRSGDGGAQTPVRVASPH